MGDKQYPLIRRDLRLIKNISRKRILFYMISVLGLDLFFFITKSETLFLKSIYGIQAVAFREYPGSFPYQWIWLQIGPMLVAFDFVRTDLYLHSSNVIIHLEKRRSYWISKQLTGGILCLLLSLVFGAVQYIVAFLFETNNVLTGTLLFRAAIYLFLCMYCLFCIYSLLALLLSEIVAFLLTLLFLCSGLPSEGSFYMMNYFMIVRSNDFGGIWYFLIVFVLCFVVGSVIIGKVDIVSTKGEKI